MLSQEQTEAINHLLKNAISKNGEKIEDSKTRDDISAISLYYMLDKNAWQIKVWIYPTNQSKTYNYPLNESDIPHWIETFKAIKSFQGFGFSQRNKDGIPKPHIG